MLKQIGMRARKEIERLLGSKVFLEIWVKVQKTGAIKSIICKITVSTAKSIKKASGAQLGLCARCF